MASVFGHFVAGVALGAAFFPSRFRPATALLAGLCACAPDLDVLAFRFGVPYGSQWGHRGWTHSIVFAAAFGLLVAALFRRPGFWPLAAWLALATLSHPLLDMLTNGGRGVALWWPFDARRLFFPWQPIEVSPLGAAAFFGEWGLRVLWSEARWIGVPAVILVMVVRVIRKLL
jgi:inner membrane protein